MHYTLGQAAKVTGKSKSVIQRAILNGRISAKKDEYEQWNIEASELHRVFPLAVPETGNKNDEEHKDTGKIKGLEGQVKALQDLLDQVQGERDNLREQNTRITALLAAPKPDPYAAILERLEAIEKEVVSSPEPTVELPRKGFWARLVG
jgi:hypothetical protein